MDCPVSSITYAKRFAPFVRWHIEGRGLLDGEVHREIPCQCDDCAKDCQRNYEDDKIFQSVRLLRFGHSTIIFVRFTAGKTFTRLKVRGTLPAEGCSLYFVFN